MLINVLLLALGIAAAYLVLRIVWVILEIIVGFIGLFI